MRSLETVRQHDRFSAFLEQASSIEMIENLPIANRGDKGRLLLVWSGVKPAMLFSLNVRKKPLAFIDKARPFVGSDNQKELEIVLAAVKTLGLTSLHIATSEPNLVGYDRIENYVFARDPAVAAIVKMEQGKFYQNDPSINQQKLGQALGFPATAAHAYEAYHRAEVAYQQTNDPSLPAPDRADYLKGYRDLPEEIRQKDWVKVGLDFSMSKDHWQEELETAKRWAQAFARLSPKLYKGGLALEELELE